MAPQCQTDFVPRATFRNSRERPGTLWRRWTGIEPAGRGSPVPAALKAVEPTRCPDTSGRHARRLDGEQVPGAGVRRRVAQLRHGPRLDLADPLAGEVEVLANLFESAGLAPVEPEAELQDLPLAIVERGQEPVDLLGQEGRGRHLERRLRRAVLHHVAQLGVAVLAQRL